MKKLCLESMADDRVLEAVRVLAGRSNEITAELLAHLGEVEVRGLHLGQACSSLFAFCVERLHMSESAAGKRITAARVARRFPVVLEMIARGDIHLTAVNMLAAHLTDENHAEVLARARHQSKRDVEKLVAELAPRPDVASRVIALPHGAAAQDVHAPERVAHAPERVEAKRPAVVAPLSPRRYEIRVTVDEGTHEALRRLQDLAHEVSERDPAVIVSRALELLLERRLAKKAAVTDRPRKVTTSGGRNRHIPAAVKRAVWQRDKARCAHVDGEGRRCSSTRSLEFHHVNNYGRGAEHDPAEIELRCRAHNQYQAVLDYGAAFIATKKASRAEQPRPRWRRCAGARERWSDAVGVSDGGFPECSRREAARCQRREARTCEPKGRASDTFGERKRAPPEETSTASEPASERLAAGTRPPIAASTAACGGGGMRSRGVGRGGRGGA